MVQEAVLKREEKEKILPKIVPVRVEKEEITPIRPENVMARMAPKPELVPSSQTALYNAETEDRKSKTDYAKVASDLKKALQKL